MSTCRACGGEIRWVRTAMNDRPMPLDPEGNKAGNVVLDGDVAHVIGAGGSLPLELAHLNGNERFMPHHASCPKWASR